MDKIAVIIILLAIVTALFQLTDKIKVPYPILLVLAGMGIGLVPHLPSVSLDPDVVFLIFLPPVLYASAWTTSWVDFRKSIRPISLLAVGCVLFTTVIIAYVAHYLIPGFGWAESFVLGAIVSPPDAVAAAAATQGLNLPKRIITILEGESLVNDATGLIAYRYGIAAVGAGSFIFWLAGINFFYVAGFGILIGFLVGFVFLWIHKITPDNPLADTTLTFLTPYTAYLIAERFHASGVLAVVVAGLFLSQRSSQIFNHQTRLQANLVWQTVIFLLNGLIFILIGLQLPLILKDIREFSFSQLIWYGSLISLATIIARILWVFPGAFVPRWLSKKIRKNEPETTVKSVSIVAWSGMRGIVSLAAALALPLVVQENTPFPNRDLIIFLTFSVIFSTLVIQGLTLPKLISWFKIKAGDHELEEERKARLKLAYEVIEHIEENYSFNVDENVLNQLKTKYEIRIQRIRKDASNKNLTIELIDQFHQIRSELIKKERTVIQRMNKSGEIGDEIMRKIERELDLEESRIILEKEY
jgi:Na+/H+ antiporter